MHQKVGGQFHRASAETPGPPGRRARCLKGRPPRIPSEEAAPESRTGRKYFHSASRRNRLAPADRQETPFQKHWL